jgi:large subunit ribosomal protein L22
MAEQDIRAQGLSLFRSLLRKCALLVNMVRGKDVIEALNILKFMPNRAAIPVSKVLSSAMSNAEENFGVSRDDLYVYQIYADEAPTRRWRRFGARGSFQTLVATFLAYHRGSSGARELIRYSEYGS